jgi:Flp pilus assembly pilin Flp
MTAPRLVKRLVGDDLGQDLIEYALLLTFIALAVVIGLQSLGGAINGQYGAASTAIAGAGGGAGDSDDGGNGGGNPGNPTPGAGTPGNGNPGTGNPGSGTGS